MKHNKDDYWAKSPIDEIADEIISKVRKYYEFLQITGRLGLYLRSYSYYYRPRLTGARMNPSGEQGELTTLSVNHYRNLLLHLETLTLQQRPHFEPRATNSDVKSQSQVILAAGLLDYYLREKKLERNIKQAIKDGLMFAEGFIRVDWDVNGGKQYGVTELGAPVQEGDIKYTNYNVLDVVRDVTQNSASKSKWFILRDFENKYDLAASFPDLEQDILSDCDDDLLLRGTTLLAQALDESDYIAVYTLIHEPTKVMPEGRYTRVLNNGTVLMDGPIPYKKAHVYRVAPDEESGTIFGYTVGFDLLPIQENLDMLYSTITTNQAAFGVQNVLVPRGSDITTSQLSGGMNVTEYDPKIGKPEPMNLTSTPPEIFNFSMQLEKLAETISGVNSVARGNPEASLKSGAALALVHAQAVQFTMNLQQSYVQLCEDIGTATIDILKDFAAVPRVAAIAGKSNRPLMREFTGESLMGIDRVLVDVGNPLTRTTSGKVNLAEMLIQNNMIDNADQFIQVITTGRLEPIIEGKQAELLLIKSENEKLSEGGMVRALVTDQHMQHIMEHKTVLANPEIRDDANSPIVTNTLNHIMEHIQLLRDTDPQLLAMINQQSLAPQGMPQDGGTSDMLNPTTPLESAADGVNMPNMPTNPMTGERAEAPPQQTAPGIV